MVKDRIAVPGGDAERKPLGPAVPRLFYEDFPLPGRDWVSTLGPYDEHLVRDYGALNLALGILLVATALFLERRLTRVALAAWLGYALPHFVYHTTLTEHFSPFDNVGQLGSLRLQVLDRKSGSAGMP